MTTIPNFIGATVAVVAALPATFNAAGYAALTWTGVIGQLVQFGELGDQSSDISVTTLLGRTLHTNGALDGGEIAFTYVFVAADAGQVILRAQSNTNTGVSLRVTDPDGTVAYAAGVVANVRDPERVDGAYKGQSGVFRINTAAVRV